ncbi:MAG: hypothetical protein AB1589_08745 [Cyanobacteriota bacterium]
MRKPSTAEIILKYSLILLTDELNRFVCPARAVLEVLYDNNKELSAIAFSV